jgi:hypothetical protein
MSRCCAQCNYRYIVNMSIMDDSGSTWVTAFNDQVLPFLFGTIGVNILTVASNRACFTSLINLPKTPPLIAL